MSWRLDQFQALLSRYEDISLHLQDTRYFMIFPTFFKVWKGVSGFSFVWHCELALWCCELYHKLVIRLQNLLPFLCNLSLETISNPRLELPYIMILFLCITLFIHLFPNPKSEAANSVQSSSVVNSLFQHPCKVAFFSN
jgi:hypothetical protein